jgi:hypothetical protein
VASNIGEFKVSIDDDMRRALEEHASRVEAAADRIEAVMSAFMEAAQDTDDEEPHPMVQFPPLECDCGSMYFFLVFDDDGAPTGAYQCEQCGKLYEPPPTAN